MAMKPGYQRTEVGVIPEDWEVMPFRRAVRTYIDYRGRTPRKLGLSWGGGNILALSANNVQMGRIDPDKEANYGSDKLYRKWMLQGECEPGDVLLTMEAPLGNIAQIPDTKRYILSQRVLLIKPKDWLLRSFLAHYMKGFCFQRALVLNSTGSTAKGIQRRKLDELPVGLPPTKVEQKAIAEALSDADALIERLEQLIAKKRHLKEGATEELLVGTKRLPGFSGPWNTCRFDNLFTVLRNASNSRDELSEYDEVAYVHYGDIHTHPTAFLNPTEKLTYISRRKVRTIPRLADGDLLMVDASEDTTAIGKAVEIVGLEGREAVAGLHTMAFRAHKNCLADEFKGYLQYMPKLRAALVKLATGVSVYGITKSGVRAIEVTIPGRAEQTAIAAFLSDMDAEITTLEAKLAKARQIKQGMMQELLTGRIRLV